MNAKGVISDKVITYSDPGAAPSEAFRVLRTNLQFLGLDRPLKSILVSSATPSEGKTTVACNLAVAFAQTGAKVCLVDADLRRPTVAKVFGTDNWTGLTTALIGQGDLEDALRTVDVPGLWILPAGPIPPNPAELLGSARMTTLLTRLEEQFEMLIVDSPPLLAVTDAAVLGPKVGGTLLVVRAGQVARQQVGRAKAALEAVKARVLGVVLDGVQPEGRDGYYYYYYYEAHGGRGTKRS